MMGSKINEHNTTDIHLSTVITREAALSFIHQTHNTLLVNGGLQLQLMTLSCALCVVKYSQTDCIMFLLFGADMLKHSKILSKSAFSNLATAKFGKMCQAYNFLFTSHSLMWNIVEKMATNRNHANTCNHYLL